MQCGWQENRNQQYILDRLWGPKGQCGGKPRVWEVLAKNGSGRGSNKDREGEREDLTPHQAGALAGALLLENAHLHVSLQEVICCPLPRARIKCYQVEYTSVQTSEFLPYIVKVLLAQPPAPSAISEYSTPSRSWGDTRVFPKCLEGETQRGLTGKDRRTFLYRVVPMETTQCYQLVCRAFFKRGLPHILIWHTQIYGPEQHFHTESQRISEIWNHVDSANILMK